MVNWTPLHAQLNRTLREIKRSPLGELQQLLPSTQRLLVAVSGGQDSLCLAKLLLDLQPKWRWHLAIAHCDHRWRPDSQANADYVQKVAETWQLPFYRQVAGNIPQSEADARQWRYRALSTIAVAGNYSYIVTGHTKSDRVETLLFNLIRGTGADGLQALSWQRPLFDIKLLGDADENPESSSTNQPPETPKSNLYLVRPLLDITRTQTGQFCQDAGLTIWEDSTNMDLKYSRNRIRHELLPYLQTHFNPSVEQAIAQTAELLRAEVEYLEQAAVSLLQEATPQSEHEVNTQSATPHRVNRLVLRSHAVAIQRRAMRQFLLQAFTGSPSFEHVEKLTALINAPNRTRTDPFPGGAIAEVQGDWICLS